MKHALTALALLATLPAPVLAETDGTLGASSSGSLKFSLNVEEQKRIQITGLTDLEYTIEKGVSVTSPQRHSTDFVKTKMLGIDGTDYICVGMDDGGTYTLDWSVSALTDGITNEPYEFRLATAGSTPRSLAIRELFNGTVSAPESGSASNLPSRTYGQRCIRSDSRGRLTVRFDYKGGQRFETTGEYVATVTLTVRPD